MVTKDYHASDEAKTEIVLKRPTWRDFAKVASKVDALLEVEPAAAFSVPEFEDVLRACIHSVGGDKIRPTRRRVNTDDQGVETLSGKPDSLDSWLDDADYQEVVKLWDAVIKHGEFIPFFEKREKEHQARVEKKQERQIRATVKQIEKLKSEGVLPSEWSLDSALNAMMRGDENPMLSLESSTSTPASTGGPGNKSKPKTSG